MYNWVFKFNKERLIPKYVDVHFLLFLEYKIVECFGVTFPRVKRLFNKLIGHGYFKESLISTLRKICGQYGNLVKQYELSISQMFNDILEYNHMQWHFRWSDIILTCALFNELHIIFLFDNFTKFERFRKNILRGAHANGGCLLLQRRGDTMPYNSFFFDSITHVNLFENRIILFTNLEVSKKGKLKICKMVVFTLHYT